MKMFATFALTALMACGMSTPASSQKPSGPTASDAALGPMAATIRNRVGEWDVQARLQFTPKTRPVVIHARATSRLLGDRWLVTEFTDESRDPEMPSFAGLGVNGFDPDQHHYVGYWVDSSRGLAIPVTGEFDPRSGVFRTVSVERQRNGASVTVVSETRSLDPNTEQTTFTAPDAQGRPFVRMQMTYTRAPAR
jgi:hypothetical protein